MELVTVRSHSNNGNASSALPPQAINGGINEPQTVELSTSKPFIQATTIEATFDEIRTEHIIPVFIKDNEPTISHADFIESTSQVVSDIYHGENILKPNIRLSHPVKGRIPEVKTSLQTSYWSMKKPCIMSEWLL